jgi:hypothetical protein
MQSGQFQLKIDKANLIKAGMIPVIAAAVAGLLWVLGLLGALLSIVFVVISAFAGYWYVNLIMKSGARPTLVDVAINGAILGAATALVYTIAAGIGISIWLGGFYVLGGPYHSIIGDTIQGAIGGAIGAAGWYAYKTGMIKTQ